MKRINKAVKGYRTMGFNMLCAALAVLPEFLPEFKEVFGDRWYLLLSIGCAIGNGYLRTITNTPLGQSGE